MAKKIMASALCILLTVLIFTTCAFADETYFGSLPYSDKALLSAPDPAGELLGNQAYTVTKNSDGTFTLVFKGELGKGESWTWQVCSNEEAAMGEGCWADLSSAMAGKIYIGDFAFDGVISELLPGHFGSGTSPEFTLPADTKWLFCGKTYAGDNRNYIMLTLGGTQDMDKMKPGSKKNNELAGDTPKVLDVPKTGDNNHIFLWSALALTSAAMLVYLSGKKKHGAF